MMRVGSHGGETREQVDDTVGLTDAVQISIWPLAKVCRRLSRYRFDGSDRRSALLQHHEKALGVMG
jgi:hypothetical protein